MRDKFYIVFKLIVLIKKSHFNKDVKAAFYVFLFQINAQIQLLFNDPNYFACLIFGFYFYKINACWQA